MKYPWYEYAIVIAPIIIGLGGGWWIVRTNWKRYGLLYGLIGITGTALCLFFVLCRFYMFPHNPLHGNMLIPLAAMVTFIPFTVCLAVKYSPSSWKWKVPFYWALVHIATLSELILEEYTKIFKYVMGWDLWSSYTWWWIFYLGFEALGGKLIPAADRRPIQGELFRYGNWGWILFHVTVVTTIFTFGMYTGKLIWGK